MPSLRTMPVTLRWALGIGVAVLTGAIVVTFLGVPSCRTPGPTRPPGPPPEADLARTDVALHPESPLVAGRNAVWCATVQLTWDAMADAVGTSGRLEVGLPAPAASVEALNRRSFPHGDLDAASYVVETFGLPGGRPVDRARERLASLGGRPPESFSRLLPGDVVAFSVLRKDLPFREPFVVHPRRLAFAGGPARVVTFGIDEDDHDEKTRRIARQAIVHRGEPEDDGPPADFAVELLPREEADRIVVATMPRPATLDAAWLETAALLARPGQAHSPGSRLAIPKVDFAATKRFDDFVGAAAGIPPVARVIDFRQRIELTLSEAGARLFSTSEMTVSRVAAFVPPVFDRPFLLALLRRGASRPYLLAWFENDDLFVKD